MDTTVTRLAEFIAGVTYDDLPQEVVTATKWLLLDCFGCTVAGVVSEKGKWGLDFTRRFFPAPPQATVLGFGDKLSAFGAAFTNAELMNGLDYEPSNKHLPPFVVPASLAVAEMNHSSGRDFILATAAAHEVGTRIGNVLGDFRALKSDGGFGLPPVTGYGFSIFAGVAGAAMLEGMSAEESAQALGLGGVMSIVNSQTPMHINVPITTAKYLMSGQACQTALAAAYLVKSGHRGDVSILDGEFGYWRLMGAVRWDAEEVLSDIGREWRFVRGIPFKQYPCCRMFHGGLDCLQTVMLDNAIKPEDIEKIHLYLEPTCIEPVFHNRHIENQSDAQFSTAFNTAVVAYGVKPGVEWASEATMKNPDILRLMDKITFEPHPSFSDALKKDPHARLSGATVTAGGREFYAETTFIKGTYGDVHGLSDDELIAKFRDCAGVALPQNKVDAACDMLLDLENTGDICELIGLLA